MEPNDRKRRIPRIAWALSAALATTSCINVPQGSTYGRSELPRNFDGGVGQLLNYCGKLQKAGKLVMAAGICERAYRLDPGNPEPLVRLAEILVQLGQIEGAENVYRTIIEIAPDHAEARYMLGKTYIALEKYDLAIIELENALSHKAGDPRFYNALGVANGLIGAHDSAQRVFRAGLQQAPDNTSLRNNLGLSLAMSGRYDEGISLLQTIAAGRNANRTSHQNLQLALGMARTARAENPLGLAALPDDLMAPPPDRQEAVAPDGLYDPLAPDTQPQVAEILVLDDQYEEDDAELQPVAEPMVLTAAMSPLDLGNQRAQIAVFEDSDPPDLPPDYPLGVPLDLEVSVSAALDLANDADTGDMARIISPSEDSDPPDLPPDHPLGMPLDLEVSVSAALDSANDADTGDIARIISPNEEPDPPDLPPDYPLGAPLDLKVSVSSALDTADDAGTDDMARIMSPSEDSDPPDLPPDYPLGAPLDLEVLVSAALDSSDDADTGDMARIMSPSEDSDPPDLPPDYPLGVPLDLEVLVSAALDSSDDADTGDMARIMSPSKEPNLALAPFSDTSADDASSADVFSADENDDAASLLAYAYPEPAPSLDTDSAPGPAEYSVQLASYRSEEHAVLGWKLLSDAAPDLFQGISPMLQSADFGPGEGIYHRLRTQFITKQRARDLCTAMKSRGLDCLVVKEPPVTETAKAEVDSTGS